MIGQLATAASMMSFVPAHIGELARNGLQAVCIGMRMLRLTMQARARVRGAAHASCPGQRRPTM